jgi:tRNA(Ile)-lysidine synthase
MNLIRGAGLKGLSGIPLCRSEGDFVVIRPLLVVSRREILAFLKSENLSYREDLSNLDTSLKRNKIRHELIPLLAKEYNPKIERTLAETARNLAEAQEVVSSAMGQLEKECVRPVSGGVCVKIEPLRAHSRTLWRELFRRVVEREFGVKVERTTLERVCQLVAGTRTRRVGVGKDLLASREYDDVLVIRKENQSPFFFEKELPIPCEVFLAPLGVEISLSFAEKGAVSLQRAQPPRGLGEIWQKIRRGEAKSFEEYFDASALRGNSVIVRTRREGDIVQPIGMRGKKKVKELFIDEKVPVTLRDRIPIVCSGGEIMWIAGYRVASQFAVKESTRRVLRLAAKVLYCGSQQYPL